MTRLARRIALFYGYGWAQPVLRRRSAIWASLLFAAASATGNRVLSDRKHRAWMRATGLT